MPKYKRGELSVELQDAIEKWNGKLVIYKQTKIFEPMLNAIFHAFNDSGVNTKRYGDQLADPYFLLRANADINVLYVITLKSNEDIIGWVSGNEHGKNSMRIKTTYVLPQYKRVGLFVYYVLSTKYDSIESDKEYTTMAAWKNYTRLPGAKKMKERSKLTAYDVEDYDNSDYDNSDHPESWHRRWKVKNSKKYKDTSMLEPLQESLNTDVRFSQIYDYCFDFFMRHRPSKEQAAYMIDWNEYFRNTIGGAMIYLSNLFTAAVSNEVALHNDIKTRKDYNDVLARAHAELKSAHDEWISTSDKVERLRDIKITTELTPICLATTDQPH
jgi:hypothetical protein